MKAARTKNLGAFSATDLLWRRVIFSPVCACRMGDGCVLMPPDGGEKQAPPQFWAALVVGRGCGLKDYRVRGSKASRTASPNRFHPRLNRMMKPAGNTVTYQYGPSSQLRA